MALLGQEEKSDKVHKLMKVSAQKAGNSCIAGSTLTVNIVCQRHVELGSFITEQRIFTCLVTCFSFRKYLKMVFTFNFNMSIGHLQNSRAFQRNGSEL